MSVENLNTESFRKALTQSGKPVLVDFWAPWCTYCRRIAPAYDAVAQQCADDLVVAKVNIDEEPALAEQEQIEVIPTLVLYRDCNAVASIVAPDSKAMIDRFLEESLKK
ncbi:MAG: thioredoxin family protein [Faecousia sp.]